MTPAIPSGYHSVTPSLTFKDSKKALAFYEKALGAKVIDQMPAPDGRGTMHATMKVGDSILMMGDEGPGCRSAESLGGSPISLCVYVPNVDEAFERAVSAGASVEMPVADMFWGDRAGNVRDPFGYAWMLATHQRDPSPAEMRKGAQEFFAKMAKEA